MNTNTLLRRTGRPALAVASALVTYVAVQRLLAALMQNVGRGGASASSDWWLTLYLIFDPAQPYAQLASLGAAALVGVFAFSLAGALRSRRWPVTAAGLLATMLLVTVGLLAGVVLGWRLSVPDWQEQLAFARWWLTDDQPPDITLSVPTAPQRGDVPVTILATDQGAAQITGITVDKTPVPLASQFTLSGAALADGPHTLEVEARDDAQRYNTGRARAIFFTDNTPPTATISFDPPVAAQGHVVFVHIAVGEKAAAFSAMVDGKPIAVQHGSADYWAVLGHDPDQKPGVRVVSVSVSDYVGNARQVTATLSLASFAFPVEVVRGESLDIPADRQYLLDPAIGQAEQKKLEAVFAPVTPNVLWTGVFAMPVQGAQSSPFAIRRSYNGGPPGSYHGGMDIAVDAGTPVAAANRGRIVLAEPLQVRGNVIVIDHGMGVYSAYYHLSAFKVQQGQTVEKGQIIGLVGNTGLSTGPHLHWEFRVTGRPVDPMQWTEKPLP